MPAEQSGGKERPDDDPGSAKKLQQMSVDDLAQEIIARANLSVPASAAVALQAELTRRLARELHELTGVQFQMSQDFLDLSRDLRKAIRRSSVLLFFFLLVLAFWVLLSPPVWPLVQGFVAGQLSP